MPTAEGSAVSCERCGAPLSLVHAGRARCLFCLHDQQLPEKVARTLGEHEDLARELGELRDLVRRTVAGRAAFLWIVGLGAPLVLVAAAGVAASVRSAEGDALGQAMFGTLGVLGLLPFVAVPIGWMRVQRVARDRQLAALPVSRPVVEGARVASLCPTCGAPHGAPGEGLTARCQSCGTEALLPLPLVSATLRRQHHAVVEARARGEAETDARMAAVSAWQAMVKPALLVFGAVFFVVLMVFIALAESR